MEPNFEDNIFFENEKKQNIVHIRIQQRNAKKTITIIEGLDTSIDLKKLVKYIKKNLIVMVQLLKLLMILILYNYKEINEKIYKKFFDKRKYSFRRFYKSSWILIKNINIKIDIFYLLNKQNDTS